MKIRKTARLLVVDPSDRLLLIKFKLPERADSFWATVGGEIEEGETFQQALIRELTEETGITAADAHITGATWFGEHDLDWGGEKTHLYERFAVARVLRAELCTDRMTDEERLVCKGLRWWTLEELRSSSETIYPPCIAELLQSILEGRIPSTPVEIKL